MSTRKVANKSVALTNKTVKKTQLATKIDEAVKKTVELVCKERVYKMNKFIEDALLDKNERTIGDGGNLLPKTPTRCIWFRSGQRAYYLL